MLPLDVVARLHEAGDILGLKMVLANDVVLAYLRVVTVERPNDLRDFSLGSASAMAVAGTGWQTIVDSSNARYLEPVDERVLYQFFYGISPSYARVYRQYQSGVDRGSLLRTRAVGTDPIGYVDGVDSRYHIPSSITEMYTVKGLYPAFNGYHPYAEPSSITVRMNFFVSTYGVVVLGDKATDEEKSRAKIVTMGGRTLSQVPEWLRS